MFEFRKCRVMSNGARNEVFVREECEECVGEEEGGLSEVIEMDGSLGVSLRGEKEAEVVRGEEGGDVVC